MCFIKVYFEKTFLDNSPIQMKIFDESIFREEMLCIKLVEMDILGSIQTITPSNIIFNITYKRAIL